MDTTDTTLLYSGTLLCHPYPGIPSTWSHDNQQKAIKTLERCQELFPGLTEHIHAGIDPLADVEDFWENAARAGAAHRTARHRGLPITTYNTDRWTPGQMARRLGPVSTIEEDGHANDPLLDHPLLREHSGRWMATGTFYEDITDDAPDNLVTLLVDRHISHGLNEAIIKFSATKSGLLHIALDADPKVVHHNLMTSDTDLGWQFIRMLDQPGAFSAQEPLDMQYEYRLFLVDGELVTGAGCIEEFTPYDRDMLCSSFDTRVRKHRGNGFNGQSPSEVEARPELVDRYITFGEQLARQSDKATVVIDVALDAATNELVVIELNTLPNSGLYASNIDAVYFAITDAQDKGYNDYPLIARILEDLPAKTL